MTEKLSWIITPVPKPEDPQNFDLPLPEEAMKAAGWQPGDPLAYKDNEDGTWTVELKIIR